MNTLITLAVAITSKFFHYEIINLSSYSLTLTDISLVYMILTVVLTRKVRRNLSARRFTLTLFLASSTVLATNVIGAYLQEASIISATLMFIKRWASLLVVPLYVVENLSREKVKTVIYILFLNAYAYIFLNLPDLRSVLAVDRFSGAFNPNVLAMALSLLVLVLLEYKQFCRSATVRIGVLIGLVAVIIAASSRGAILALVGVLLLRASSRVRFNFRYSYTRILLVLFTCILILLFHQQLLSLVKETFSFSYSRLAATLDNRLIYDASASARINTQAACLRMLGEDRELLLFGSGFGNHNMMVVSSRYGLRIDTADNQYIDILFWTGGVGFLTFCWIILRVFVRIARSPKTTAKTVALHATTYMLLAGISQDTFTEPTVLFFYMLVLGVFEIELTSETIRRKKEGETCGY